MAVLYRIDESFDRSFFKDTSCAFGVFDGVHTGHRYLLESAVETACASGGKSVALTFDVDPDEIFSPATTRKIMSNEERLEALAASGVDAVAVFPFTPEFAANDPADFLSLAFGDGAPAYLHVGSDFRFGARAAGSVNDLNAWAEKSGTRIQAHHLLNDDGAPITATRIRTLLGQGYIEEANRLLGHRYFVVGEVEPGRGEGADFGFRTANVSIPEQRRTLGEGVYAAYAFVDGVGYKAAVNVGVPPTFADRSTSVIEAHLLDFEGDLYGAALRIEFTNWLRALRNFSSVDKLISTVNYNIEWVRANL